jgi:hypothetical protein
MYLEEFRTECLLSIVKVVTGTAATLVLLLECQPVAI